MKQISTILRWILILPASIAGSILGFWLALLLQFISDAFLFVEPGYFLFWHIPFLDHLYVFLFLIVIPCGFSGFAAIFCGCFVAPKFKGVVSIVLATLWAAVGVLTLLGTSILAFKYSLFSELDTWRDIVGLGASIIGFISGSIFVWNDERQ